MEKQKQANEISWDAEEHIQYDKKAGWYIGLTIISLILIALSIWRGWWTFIVLIIVSAIALVVYTIRPPRKLHYVLNDKGLLEDQKLYSFSDFKAFGIMNEDGVYSIILIPRKRFSPRVTVYFPKDSGEKIVDAFGIKLPMEKIELDLLDRLIKFLRI